MIHLTKRLGIFCMYDSEGIVDEYIIFLLQNLKEVLSHLMIVCNGKLTPKSRRCLEEITDDVFVRDNSGFDMEAWRQGILRHKNNLNDYDELVLLNDSFYGPLYPFKEVFDRMDTEKPNADFWGLTIHGKTEDASRMCPYGYIPEHIQSFFLVIRAHMFHSPEFLRYWEDAKTASNFDEAIMQHEVCFTKDFFDKGFTYAVYCDTRDWENSYELKINHYLLSTEKLLKHYRCPVIKKKVFMMPRSYYINENYGDAPHKCIEFIKNCTNYDTALIWKNLLRLKNISELKATLGWDYVLPENFPNATAQINFRDVAIVAHLYYEDLMAECVNYLCNAPPDVSIFVTVDKNSKKLRVEGLFKAAGRNCEVRIVAGRGRDLSALLVGCKDVLDKFKYLCFIHDKKSRRPGKSISIGDSFFHMLWNNTLASENFIKNILTTFENEKNLGLLVPPPPHHGEYKFFIHDYWTSSCFDESIKLAEKLNIPANFLNRGLSPLAIGSVFWCKTAALKKIFAYDWKVEEFPAEPMPDDGTISHALERIFPFAAQAEGFYTGWLMTESFVRDELENFIYFSSEPRTLPSIQSIPSVLQAFKYWVKSNVPTKYWFLLYPFKHLLEKLGFKL